MVEVLRTYCHQLTDQAFENAYDLVSFMGAVQGQEIEMSKWAVGMRLRRPSLSHVRDSIDSGRIIRTHILRPTWHLVASEDIRWMLGLCDKRIRTAFLNWGKKLEIDQRSYSRFCDTTARLLDGNNHQTVQEITWALNDSGNSWDISQIKLMLTMAEADALLCSGREKGRKHSYALLDERVPATACISREEALSLLATKYFRSHSPASLEDFIWWSGLTATEAKAAVVSLGQELITDMYEDEKLYVHFESYTGTDNVDETIHLLPPYDEYLIGYKDRTHVLDPRHCSKAHNNYGIFYPVIYHKGKIVGNWKKITQKGNIEVETTFFNQKDTVGKRKLQTAVDRYVNYLKE